MLYWGGIVKKVCDGGGHFEYKCSYIQYRYANTLLGLYGVLYWISSPQKHIICHQNLGSMLPLV